QGRGGRPRAGARAATAGREGEGSRFAVVGIGTTTEPCGTKRATARPSASATSRRPSLSARIALRSVPSYRPYAATRSVGRCTRIGSHSGAHASQNPLPSALQLAHCGGKKKSSNAGHATPLDHDGG